MLLHFTIIYILDIIYGYSICKVEILCNGMLVCITFQPHV